ncbi:hypothetical protein ACN20G_17230 [Streptomyces sp. BI20]|uniref:hypothetical protein n=1 Tax=Streptomyces sp. BI20 TaxID=3403460 RepID=UPI003C7145DF
MSLLTTLARLEAVRAEHARPLATVRHRHLSERPLVLVPLTTSGEAGAPLGALVGTAEDAPRLLIVAQPRDRDLRWRFLADLADEVLPYLESFDTDVEEVERTETDPDTGKPVKVLAELCRDAPQVIVPGRAGVQYVRLLGRSMRFRRTAEQDPDTPHPVPTRVPLLGRWFTHIGERAHTPGSGLLTAAGDLLARHWATGRSTLEDQHLGSLLAWIDPAGSGLGRPGESGARAAERLELDRDEHGVLRHPPAGPATDPAFDNRLLAPAMARFDAARALDPADPAAVTRAEAELRALIDTQLRPTWHAVWRAVDLLRTLPEGEHVDDRWTRDRWSHTSHRDRVRAGEPPQPRHDDAVTAARKLASREREQVRLDAQEALDDPLVMAGRRLAGEAFEGEVTEVVMEWTDSKRPSPRPLLVLSGEDGPQLAEPGTKVWRSLDGRPQAAEFVGWDGPQEAGRIVLRLLDKMGRGREPEPGSVPEKGDRTCWTLFEHDVRSGPRLPEPEQTPWTHGGPPTIGEPNPPAMAPARAGTAAGAPRPAEAPDPLTAEDVW